MKALLLDSSAFVTGATSGGRARSAAGVAGALVPRSAEAARRARTMAAGGSRGEARGGARREARRVSAARGSLATGGLGGLSRTVGAGLSARESRDGRAALGRGSLVAAGALGEASRSWEPRGEAGGNAGGNAGGDARRNTRWGTGWSRAMVATKRGSSEPRGALRAAAWERVARVLRGRMASSWLRGLE